MRSAQMIIVLVRSVHKHNAHYYVTLMCSRFLLICPESDEQARKKKKIRTGLFINVIIIISILLLLCVLAAAAAVDERMDSRIGRARSSVQHYYFYLCVCYVVALLRCALAFA